MNKVEFQINFTELTNIPQNRFHPLVWLVGDPEIGENVYIGGMSEVYAKGAYKCLYWDTEFYWGGVHIGHHSVVGAGTVVRSGKYPPYSLIVGNPAVVKTGYYKKRDS